MRSLRTIFYCSGGGEFPHEFPAQNRQCSGREHTYLFAGEQRDATVALDYLRRRYLCFNLGRFETRDPFRGFLFSQMDRNKYLYGLANPVSNTDPAGLYSLAELSANLAVRGYLSSSSYVKLAIAGGKLISRAHALARYVSIANSAFRLAFFVGSFFDKGAKGIESDISHEFQFTPDSSITIIASIRPPKGTLSFKPTYKSVSGEYAFTYDFERGKFDNNQGALSVKYDRLRDSIGLGTAKFDIESLSVVLEGEADSFSAGLEFEFLQAFSIGVGVDFEFPRDISTFVTLRGTKIVTVHC